MKGDLHEIDDLFKAGLESKEEQPEDKVWNAIEQDLDKNSAISIRKKYDRLRRASVILLILLLGISIYALRDTFINNSGKATRQEQSNPSGPGNKESTSGKSMYTPADADGSGKSMNKSAVEGGSGKLMNKSADAGGTGKSLNKSANADGTGKSLNKSANADGTGKSLNKSANADVNNKSSFKASDNSTGAGLTATEKAEVLPVKKSGVTRNDGLSPVGNVSVTINTVKSKNNSSINNSKNNNKGKGNHDKSANGKNILANNANTSTLPKREPATSGTATASTSLDNKTSSQWEIALIDYNIRHDLPDNTTKLSSSNALSDLMKSNPANNLSIPVKNKRSSTLDLPRISITPMASINLMSNKIKNDLTHPGSQGNEKEDIENTESEELSFSFSLLADIRIAPRMTLQTGIGYMEKTTAIDPKKVGAVRTGDGKIKYQFDCSAGRYYLNPKYGTWPAVGDSAYTIASANELHYLTIPLAVKYYFGNNKLNFFAIAGGDANILLGQDLTTGLYGASYYGKKTPPKPIGLNNVFVNAMLGAGVNYSLNRWLGLTFSPTYRFALNPINKDMPFKAYPRSVSFAGGLRISL